MAEKILNTRIINKHAELSEWSTSSLLLKTGEIALARVETTKPDGHGGFYKVPTYLMKIGDGNKTFSELEWLAAPASDVFDWAKASTKPTYNAAEIGRGTSTVAADLQKAEQDIIDLKTAIGESGAVADAIKAAIEALDVTDAAVDGQFVTAVAEADGKISVTRRALSVDDIPTLEISKINGLQTALDAKAAKTYVDEQDNAIKTSIGSSADAAGTATVYGAIATAKAAGDTASSDLADYETANDARVKAIEDDYTTADEAGSIAQSKVDTLANGQVKTNTEAIAANAAAIATEKSRVENIESDLNTRLTAAEDAITSLNAATTLEGVGTLTNRPTTGKAAGAIYIATDNNKEYVWDGKEWIELGDTTAELLEISDLKERVSAIETDLGTDGDVTRAIAAAQTAIDDHVANKNNPHGVTATQLGVGDFKDKTVAGIKTEFTGSVADGNTGFVTGDAAYDAIESAKSAANSYADGIVSPVSEKANNNATDITTIKNNYARVDGDMLVYGQGDSVMTIIFDCGGAE